ncbi:hypothetical protein [Chryseobacterium bernardetii]|uniref:hypothetical protein n=1 Tax=Chryseobacterium bernardetii TaxID=1241978 RepID=UPI0016253138|nr:hypothetical protein [Chryseobacterium bernardetii]
MKNLNLLLIVILAFSLQNCDSVKKMNSVKSPFDGNIEGCPGGFAIRAKNAKIINSDSIKLSIIMNLAASAKADAAVTDSLLDSGFKGKFNGNLTAAFKRYFEVDQSISEDIWNQSTAFTQLYCLLDKISNDQNTSKELRDQINQKKISFIETQMEYNRNLKKKEALKTNN